MSKAEAAAGGSGNSRVEAKVLAAVWDRNRVVCAVKDRSQYPALFRWLRSYIPRYRQLLILGEVPEETLHLYRSRILEGDDFASQQTALEQAFSEEETGAPPIHIINFGLGEEVFSGLLKHLDRGWVSFSPGLSKKTLDSLGFSVHEDIPQEWGTLFILDPPASDLSAEEELLLETAPCSPAVKDFMIQMRQSQVYLAFQAIIAELEAGKTVTRAYLSETLRVKEKTLKKILHVGLRERRLNLAPYIKDTPQRVIDFLKSLSRSADLTLAALFEGEQLVGYARYRECFFPSRSFLAINQEIENLEKTSCEPGQPWFVEMITGDNAVQVFRGRYLYGFLLEAGTEVAVFRYRAAEGIEKLEKEIG